MKIRMLDIDELNERLVELEGLRDTVEAARDAVKEAETDDDKKEAEADLEKAEEDFGTEEAKELADLESLKDDIGERRGKIDTDGGPFVREDDFEEYARELAEDIGAIPSNAEWPCRCIDWAAAADELKMDYSSIEWGGDTYLYRA